MLCDHDGYKLLIVALRVITSIKSKCTHQDGCMMAAERQDATTLKHHLLSLILHIPNFIRRRSCKTHPSIHAPSVML